MVQLFPTGRIFPSRWVAQVAFMEVDEEAIALFPPCTIDWDSFTSSVTGTRVTVKKNLFDLISFWLAFYVKLASNSWNNY